MRIGLVGAMANNMYCMARVLRQQGYDAYYVEDEADSYPMSQPLWEEVPLTLEWRRFGTEPLDRQGWRELARTAGWAPPEWIVRPNGSRSPAYAIRLLKAGLWPGSGWTRDLTPYVRELEPLVEKLKTYDRLVVCGVRNVAALLSGRPYVYWPHGGDVRVVPFRQETDFDRAFARLARRAIGAAAVAGTHDPTIADRLEELGRRGPIPYLPFLVDVDRYSPGEPASAVSLEVQARAGGRVVLLHASRQDFTWKGTDRFARAYAAAVAKGVPLYLVVPPWGADAEATRQIFVDHRVLDSVHYLDSAVSKPILRDLYRAADLVVDQFTMTAFGTTMLEAMSCGTPVLINLDLEAFRRRWPDFVPPPTLRASSADEIEDVLRSTGEGTTDLRSLGHASREWVREHHGPGAVRLYAGELDG